MTISEKYTSINSTNIAVVKNIRVSNKSIFVVCSNFAVGINRIEPPDKKNTSEFCC